MRRDMGTSTRAHCALRLRMPGMLYMLWQWHKERHKAGKWKHTGSSATSHLEVGDQVFKVMQLQQVILTLGQHRQRHPQHDVGAVLCQHHVNHPACNRGRKGAAEDGEEPLGSIQHRDCSIVLQAQAFQVWQDKRFIGFRVLSWRLHG